MQDLTIDKQCIEKWQNIVNIMAELINVPAGLIMRINGSDIEVLVSSETEYNPYHVGDKEHLTCSGLYCETVIKTKNKLLIPDAKQDEKWQNNPDIKLGMVSYLGYPLILPDGGVFGTICVLDSKENHYSQLYEKLILQLKELIETHLALLYKNQELENIANKDWLTQLYNRRYFFIVGEKFYQNAKRRNLFLSISMIDIDFFKNINDNYGHDGGDFILKEFSKILIKNTRKADIVSRFGGEEFCILLTNCNLENAILVCERIRKELEINKFEYQTNKISVTISCGISSVLEGSLEKMVNKADAMVYKAKKNGRNQTLF
ncbi:sensor domain-containing diguanylate cyclase [Crocosphaera sp. UHCC 0190]|uniref:sensor domain-containing diguanylate cyclase n=1 Tax=Crocosphaera sp. UHCC 0190 TaxID=3110246 RepID=UPI002B21DC96|nr:sensor domain-containing diguanylate cyclase [Crocosphaera sp. UHCC 0190]MEA5509608.1 sensor domain-containing diguanylate cyclase [Crocosphaera sp. UHCC 0190]